MSRRTTEQNSHSLVDRLERQIKSAFTASLRSRNLTIRELERLARRKEELKTKYSQIFVAASESRLSTVHEPFSMAVDWRVPLLNVIDTWLHHPVHVYQHKGKLGTIEKQTLQYLMSMRESPVEGDQSYTILASSFSISEIVDELKKEGFRPAGVRELLHLGMQHIQWRWDTGSGLRTVFISETARGCDDHGNQCELYPYLRVDNCGIESSATIGLANSYNTAWGEKFFLVRVQQDTE